MRALTRRYDEFFRRYLALSRDNWKQYTRVFPLAVDYGLANLSHPVFGPLLRRFFRFEGQGHYAEACVVPINQELDFHGSGKNLVMPVQKVREAIAESSYRVIFNRCICRDSYGCTNFPRDFACIMIGEACRTMVGRGVARYATVEECLEHLDRATEMNLVAICAWTEMESLAKGVPEENKMKYIEICLCCPCCCNGLNNFKEWHKTPQLRKLFKSVGWHARSTEACVGCGLCAEVCPMDAISVDSGGIQVADDRCLGCGLCAVRCPQQAIVMKELRPLKEHLLDYFGDFRPEIRG